MCAPMWCLVCCGVGRLTMVHGPAVDLWEEEKSLLVVLTYCADYSAEMMSWQPCATFFPGHILMLCHTGLGLCLDPQSHDKKFTQLNLHFSGRMSFLPIYQISNLVLLFFPQRQATFSRPSLTETSLPTFSRHLAANWKVFLIHRLAKRDFIKRWADT